MAQTNKQSMIEVVINTVTGFFTSMGIQLIIFPIMDIPVTLNENFTITFVFMFFGIIKGFVMRRIFNKIWN
tara:strand:- start:2824 stop:3036 length:213 start_codon:yes stop_codon:yes gene_type:complete